MSEIDPFRIRLYYSNATFDPRFTGHPTQRSYIEAIRRLIDGGSYVRVVLFKPAAYSAWRLSCGRPDTRRARMEWARRVALDEDATMRPGRRPAGD